MTIRAVVVDIGGVLEDTPDTGWVQRWEDRLGLATGGLREIVGPVWGPGRVGAAPLSEIERRTAAVLGLGPEDASALWDDVWRQYVGTLNTAFYDYFAGLRPRYRTGILSNSFVGAREREDELYAFADVCDVLVYSHEVGVEKPDPQAYKLVCELLAVSPEEVVFIDDVEENVAAARGLGMTAVLFVDEQQAISELDTHLAS